MIHIIYLLILSVFVHELYKLTSMHKNLLDQCRGQSRKINELNDRVNYFKKVRKARQKNSKRKQQLMSEHGAQCQYCEKSFGAGELTVDHYMPISLGGDNSKSNCRLACNDCNTLKADMHPDEWEKMQKNIKVFTNGVRIVY